MTVEWRTKRKKYEQELEGWRNDTEHALNRGLYKRIREADAARVDMEAGSSRFLYVRWWQRAADRFHAVADSTVRLHRVTNPVQGYREKLRAKVLARRAKAGGAKRLRKILENREDAVSVEATPLLERDDGAKILPSDRLRADIAFKCAYLSQIEETRDVQLRPLDELVQSLEADAKEADADYHKWYRHLGRPAYGETLNFRSLPLSGASVSAGTPEQKPSVSDAIGDAADGDAMGFVKTTLVIVAKYSTVALVPLEALYAWDAFKVVTPEQSTLALTAAFIFTLCLAGTGALAAVFAIRTVRHHLSEQVSDGKVVGAKVESKVDGKMAAAAILCVLIGLVLVLSGAELRSKIFKAHQWDVRDKELRHKRDEALSQPMSIVTEDENTINKDSSVEASQERFDKTIAVHDLEREDILAMHWAIDSSDKLIAIGIYLALFVFGASNYIASRDPYNEYAILASYVQSVRDMRRRVDVLKDAFLRHMDSRKETLKTNILELRSQLWLLAPNDPLALSPYQQKVPGEELPEGSKRPEVAAKDKLGDQPKGDASSVSEEEGGHVEHEKVLNGLRIADLWVADRTARYAWWYLATLGHGARERYGDSFDEALRMK